MESFSAAKKNEICRKVELEKAIVSEVTRTQKYKHHVFSLMYGFQLQIFSDNKTAWSNNRN